MKRLYLLLVGLMCLTGCKGGTSEGVEVPVSLVNLVENNKEYYISDNIVAVIDVPSKDYISVYVTEGGFNSYSEFADAYSDYEKYQYEDYGVVYTEDSQYIIPLDGNNYCISFTSLYTTLDEALSCLTLRDELTEKVITQLNNSGLDLNIDSSIKVKEVKSELEVVLQDEKYDYRIESYTSKCIDRTWSYFTDYEGYTVFTDNYGLAYYFCKGDFVVYSIFINEYTESLELNEKFDLIHKNFLKR